MRTFGDLARQGRDNNFNLIRVIAATAVLISHSFFIATALPIEPLATTTHFKLGTQGLMVFFAISGFLITSSFVRRVSLIDFVTARMARIVPGLFGCTLVVALAIGPTFSTFRVGAYFAHLSVWLSLIAVPTFIHFRMDYPGVFATNPAPVVNGSLWSLPYEIACYGVTMLIGLLGLLKFKPMITGFVIAIIVIVIAKVFAPALLEKQSVAIVMPFALGSFFYIARELIPLNSVIMIALVIISYLTASDVIGQELYIFALCYGTFWLAALRGLILYYNNIGDYSYGIYIYAWPVQEAVVAIRPGIEPLTLAIVAFFVTLPIAIASWYLIERPALVHRHYVGAWLSRFGRRYTADKT